MSSCVSALLGDRIKSVPPVYAKPRYKTNRFLIKTFSQIKNTFFNLNHRAYESIRNVRSSLKPYWNCFKFDGIFILNIFSI